MIDVGVPQTIVGGTTSGKVVRGRMRKQAEWVKETKSVSNIFPWSLCQFFTWVPTMASLKDRWDLKM